MMTLYEEARESFLQILVLADHKAKVLEEQGDLAGMEILVKDVILKYQELYSELSEEVLATLTEEELKGFRHMLSEVQKQHGIKKADLEEAAKKRKALAGKSGAEVVKRLYEYKHKEFHKEKWALADEIKALEEEVDRKNVELCQAIQEKDQIKIIEEMQGLRARLREFDKKAIDIQKKLDYTHIDKKVSWKIDMYGTMTEEKMKAAYQEFTSSNKK